MNDFDFPQAGSLPESMSIDPASLSMKYLVGGEVRTWKGAGQEVLSPVCVKQADGRLSQLVLGTAPLLTAEAATEALMAAKKAWDSGRGPWPTMRVARRIGALENFAKAMREVRETVVRLLCLEIGKSRKDAESEFDRTVQYITDTVDALKEQDRGNSRFVMEEGFIGQIRRSPLGVVLCMGPFNYPLNETYTTLIPALIMGNTIVAKLPKYGCLLHVPLLEAMAKCFPPGVVNVIQGDGPTTIGPIMQSGDVDCLAFIGTSHVVNLLKRQHPRPNRLRSITGLEAKNPAVILPDADLNVAVKECVSGALSFNGQRCTALKLILVHKSISQQFVEKFSQAVDNLKAGMPWDSGVQITPLPEYKKSERLQALIDDAKQHGAKVVNQGGQSIGTFFRPAVVFPVAPAARLYHEEQFGPIVPIAEFTDEAEIDEFMRESAYGQQVALFGKDPKKMAFLIDAMVNQVSRININSQCRRGPDTFPFTGRKDSAEGTLSVTDALRAFSIRAVVATTTTDENKEIVGDIVSRRLSTFLSTDFIF